MKRRRSLRNRLVATYLAVVAVVVVTGFLTVRLLTPTLFQQRIQSRGGLGGGPGTSSGQGLTVPGAVQTAYDDALTVALVIAAAVGLALAVALALWMTRAILRRVGGMREATRRLAGGDYRIALQEPVETELADLAHSINKLGTELAATEQARARLVSDLAHELRNPLATIEGYMEGLIDGVLPADTHTYTTVAAEAHRLKHLTDDLSLLSRAQEGALDLELGPLDLGVVTRSVAERLRPQYDGKGVELVTELDTPLPVEGDVDRLTQAITNLAGNALTHTPPHGRVTIAGARSRSQCRIEVTDTGQGIPEDQLETVFQRFTRLDPSNPGTGIGLNIARTIAHLHQGDLTAQSDGPGAGATFTLTLPALT